MPVFANGGTGSAAITSCASTSPRASSSPTARGTSGCDRVENLLLRVRERDHVRPRRATRSRNHAPSSGPRSSRSSASSMLARRKSSFCPTSKRPPRALVAEHGLFLEQQRDRIGELQLAATARLDAIEHVEDLGREHVATDDREVRRRLIARRLLDDAPDLEQTLARSWQPVRRTRTTRSPPASPPSPPRTE